MLWPSIRKAVQPPRAEQNGKHKTLKGREK